MDIMRVRVPPLAAAAAAWVALLAALPAGAAPAHLGDFYFAGNGSFSADVGCSPCVVPSTAYFDITSVPVARDGPPPAGWTSVSLFGALDGVHLGIGLATGTVGQFDYDAGNAPGFDALAQRLTDGRNDNQVYAYPFGTANDRAGEATFGQLSGTTLSFIRLVVDDDSYTSTATGMHYSLRTHWEFWGDAAPVVSPVPEPDTILMWLLGGALVLGAARGRRRGL